MREHILLTMCDLLEAQGYHATGLNQLVKESGAPKGSLYHYFPTGKDGLTEEAIERTGISTASRISQGLAQEGPAADVIKGFIEWIAGLVESSGFRSGGPLTTVAMETATSNERLNLACRTAFGRIEAAFAERLVLGGYRELHASELARFITAAIEGGIILSRTYHSGDPLRLVARELARFLATEKERL